jgi:antitoxin HicB
MEKDDSEPVKLKELMEEVIMSKYTVILIPEAEGGYSVEVPSLPGCYTQGDTKQEAIDMAKEAIELYLESCKAHNEPIPVETGIESLSVEVKNPIA